MGEESMGFLRLAAKRMSAVLPLSNSLHHTQDS